MKKTFVALTLVLLLGAGALVSGCGGGGSSSERTVASSPAQAQTPNGGGVAAGSRKREAGETAHRAGGSAGAKAHEESASAGGSGKRRRSASAGDSGRHEKAASLDTRPHSIAGAIVTAAGAVQTLPPSERRQTEALHYSYPSIRNFGEEVSGSEATTITFAMLQYLDAKAQGEWATACARLYSVLREHLSELAARSEDPAVREGGCPAAFATLAEPASSQKVATEAEVDVASIRKGEDNRAFVIYKTPETVSADMPMYLENGIWTVGALEAYVLTPEQLEENQ
jgi:hypothetical protein